MQPDSATEARCYRHPQREAWIRCTRCDRPICPDCMRPASVGFHCPDDVAAGARETRRPRSAVGATLTQSPPFVTIALVAMNVVAYIYTGVQSVRGFNEPAASPSSSLFYHWQLQPKYTHDHGDYYQLLTSAFLHANLLHIASNMLALAVIGPTIEAALGWWRFAAVYLMSALGGGAAIYAFGDALGYTVGASGAVFGLFGAALILVRKIGLDAQWLVGIVVLNFVLTFSVAGISKLGHLGGFATGLLAGLVLGGLPNVPRRVPVRAQAAGLGVVAAGIVILVAVRTATW